MRFVKTVPQSLFFSFAIVSLTSLSLVQIEAENDKGKAHKYSKEHSKEHNKGLDKGEYDQKDKPDMFFAAPKSIFDELDLSEQQREQLHAMREDPKVARENYQQYSKERESFEALLKDPSSSPQQLNKQLDKVVALQSEMSKKRLQRMVDLRQVLSPEQLNDFFEKMSQRRQESMGNLMHRKGQGLGNKDGLPPGLAKHGGPPGLMKKREKERQSK
jgi:Spy/CpxP family protein refolding chaperone